VDDGRRCSPALKMSGNMNDARMTPIRFESRDQTHGGALRSPLVASIRSPERRIHSGLDQLPHHPASALGARNGAAIADQGGTGLDTTRDFLAFGLDHPKGGALKPVSRAATNVVSKSVDVSAIPRLVVDALSRWGDA